MNVFDVPGLESYPSKKNELLLGYASHDSAEEYVLELKSDKKLKTFVPLTHPKSVSAKKLFDQCLVV